MVLERPGRAADRLQVAGGISEEVFAEAGHERNRVGEPALEERSNGLGRRQDLEALFSLVRQKQGHGEAAVDVGERDQHVFASRPDMQGVLVHPKSAAGGRRDRELLVPVAERLLVEPSACPFQDLGANRRGASIRPDEDVVGCRSRLGIVSGRKAHPAVREIDAADRLSEADRDSAGRFGGIQEERVQARARNRVDDFMRLVAVGNQPEPPFLVVKHPPGHRNERATGGSPSRRPLRARRCRDWREPG